MLPSQVWRQGFLSRSVISEAWVGSSVSGLWGPGAGDWAAVRRRECVRMWWSLGWDPSGEAGTQNEASPVGVGGRVAITPA